MAQFFFPGGLRDLDALAQFALARLVFDLAGGIDALDAGKRGRNQAGNQHLALACEIARFEMPSGVQALFAGMSILQDWRSPV